MGLLLREPHWLPRLTFQIFSSSSFFYVITFLLVSFHQKEIFKRRKERKKIRVIY
jgi:hypothetical protein